MGNKGDKKSNASGLTAALLLEKLGSIDGITSKSMFGGHGIFHDGKMFCMVDSKGTAYLKANETNQSTYESAGAQPQGRMPYFSIPDAVFNDLDLLVDWAKSAIAITK